MYQRSASSTGWLRVGRGGPLIYAKGIAGRLGLEVILLHVASKGEAESLPLHRAYMDQVTERFGRELSGVREKAGGRPSVVKGEVAVGYAADEILRHAAEKEADLILMATHGRSGVRRWVLGSVADKVLRSAVLPVLLIRAGMPKDAAYETWSGPKMLVPLDGSELAELVLPHVEALASARDGAAEVVLAGICEPLVLPPATTPETSVNWGDRGRRVYDEVQEVGGEVPLQGPEGTHRCRSQGDSGDPGRGPGRCDS